MMMMMMLMMMMMIMTLMKLVNSATKFRHGMDKFYQPNSGLRSSRSLDEAIYTACINICIHIYIHMYCVCIEIYTLHISMCTCIYIYIHMQTKCGYKCASLDWNKGAGGDWGQS